MAFLSPIYKVLEKNYSQKNCFVFRLRNLFNKSQSGFRSGRSTEQATAALILEINDSLNYNKHVSALFFDIKKVFFTRNHEILMDV